ncbi:phage baseplate assembly protein V [Paraburkholderia tropica]|uniref:phage baseplate assembly protein V n=1 Tax=Paraburkholderia tropica TaxID=92647 RepID=UPI002AB68CA2|nr:phage baseplate assembly protein V [Paraburkholderia tropica]
MDANEFRRLIVNLIRKGSVLDVDLTSTPPTCRVSVGDPDDTESPGLQTNWIPFLMLRAGNTREWNPPTKGEQVILFCPMGDPAQGVALAGINSETFPAPSNSAAKHMRVYPDGATLEYDHAAHTLTATLPEAATVLIVAPGAVNVQTKQATVQADAITLDGDATVTKSLTVKGPFAFENGMTGKGGDGNAVMKIAGGADFDGEVTSQGKSLPHHRHADDGTGEPQ